MQLEAQLVDACIPAPAAATPDGAATGAVGGLGGERGGGAAKGTGNRTDSATLGGGEDDDNASWRTTGNKYLGHPASIKTIEVVVHGTVCWCCACVSVCVWGGGYRR